MNKFFISLCCLSAFFAVQAKQKPNIILIVADDLGYSDLGVYGSEISTPHLDGLAKDGVAFQEFYTASVGAPSRASILTGLYPHQAGVGYFFGNLGPASYQGYLNQSSLTLAEVLRSAGYTTLHAGSWGVGLNGQATALQRGFSHSFLAENGGSYFDEHEVTYQLDGKPFTLADDSYYLTDLITDQAISFIHEGRSAKQQKPFFLYLSYTAPHWPLHAPTDDVIKYHGKYNEGYETLRSKRLEGLKKAGLVSKDFKLPEKDKDIYDWDKVAYNIKEVLLKRQEVYAAQVDHLDQNIGRLLQQLKIEGLDNNTIIIFLSDNGAPSEDIVRWHRGAIRNSSTVGTSGSFESFGKEWAYLSNSPFRGFKDQLYEGGISSPLIIWGIEGQKRGVVVKGTGHVIDIAPTLYQLAGARYPNRFQGHNVTPLAGVSLLSVVKGNGDVVERNEPIFWEHAGNRAVRQGDWKLESHYPNLDWFLYNISEDRGETINQFNKHTDIVAKLGTAYYEWARQNGVVDFYELKAAEPDTLYQLRRSRTKHFRKNYR